MSDVLLTLVMPTDIAQHVEDLLLAHPEIVRGFTAQTAEGHGSAVELLAPEELVAGHSPRTVIRTLGQAEDMQAVLTLVRQALPGARIFYWLSPVLAMGYL